MSTSRVEAFSDGVLAIIITIMVLELNIPEGQDFAALRETTGTGFLTYLLSFVYVGIYWNNHHHMFQLADRVTGAVLWANLHLLFWLSLLPFTTAWMDDSGFARTPVVLFGIDLFGAAIAYSVLQAAILRGLGPESTLRQALGRDVKGRISPAFYISGIAAAWLGGVIGRTGVWIALACFVAVAILWLVPDTRLERAVVAERET